MMQAVGHLLRVHRPVDVLTRPLSRLIQGAWSVIPVREFGRCLGTPRGNLVSEHQEARYLETKKVTGELSFDSKALRLTEKGACLFSIEFSYCEKGQRGTIFATRRLESWAEKKGMELS